MNIIQCNWDSGVGSSGSLRIYKKASAIEEIADDTERKLKMYCC